MENEDFFKQNLAGLDSNTIIQKLAELMKQKSLLEEAIKKQKDKENKESEQLQQ